MVGRGVEGGGRAGKGEAEGEWEAGGEEDRVRWTQK